jgi:hypothetical protein
LALGADPSNRNKVTVVSDAIVTNDEIREVIATRPGKFTTAEISAELKKRHPGKSLRDAAVPSLIFNMKHRGKLKEVARGIGHAIVYQNVEHSKT